MFGGTACYLGQFCVFDHHKDTGRSPHSERLSTDTVKIWIMLITPGISIPCLTVWCLPLTDPPLSRLSVSHLVTLGLLGCSLTNGQQDWAESHCADTHISQRSPVQRHSSRFPGVKALSAVPETLEGWVKGQPPPSACFSDTVACSGTITFPSVLLILQGTTITQCSRAQFTTGIFNEKLYPPHISLLSPLEISCWTSCWDWNTWPKSNS